MIHHPGKRDSTWEINFSKQEEARQGLEYLILPLYLCFTLLQHKVPYKLQKHHPEELSSFSSPTSQVLFSTELLNLKRSSLCPHSRLNVLNSLPQHRNTELQAPGLALAQNVKSHLCTGTNFSSRRSQKQTWNFSHSLHRWEISSLDFDLYSTEWTPQYLRLWSLNWSRK